MKISHAQLESFRANPSAFVAGQNPRTFSGPSMFRMWQYALKKVHSENFDIAAEYLHDTIVSNFKVNERNAERMDNLIEDLQRYADAFESLGHVAIEVLKPMNFVVNSKLIITGEITRLDLIPAGGYAAFVLSREEGEDWRRQIRFPLIQAHYARKLNCSLNEISVGVYSVPDRKHELQRFSALRVSAAQNEIIRLAKRLPQ
jgi:hypothetical protein